MKFTWRISPVKFSTEKNCQIGSTSARRRFSILDRNSINWGKCSDCNVKMLKKKWSKMRLPQSQLLSMTWVSLYSNKRTKWAMMRNKTLSMKLWQSFTWLIGRRTNEFFNKNWSTTRMKSEQSIPISKDTKFWSKTWFSLFTKILGSSMFFKALKIQLKHARKSFH